MNEGMGPVLVRCPPMRLGTPWTRPFRMPLPLRLQALHAGPRVTHTGSWGS